LDGATGTELTRRGADTRLPLWSARALVEAPAKVLEIHRDYVAAGAEVVTANTFRTHRRSLAHGGLGAEARRLSQLAVDLARDAARNTGAYVAGSISPLEDCYRPDLVPDDAALVEEHAEMAKNLAAAGADLLLVETMNTVREAWVATAAAKETGLPVLSSVVTGLDASSLLSGESLVSGVKALAPLRPDALLVNCVPARRLLAPLRALVAAAGRGVRIGAYGNIGHADGVHGWSPASDVPPDEYARLAGAWLAAGASIVGGCCGTGPAHVAALRRALDELGRNLR
jgi:S-methylmethionine-dependent homocysteine/selenocysteine methylase